MADIVLLVDVGVQEILCKEGTDTDVTGRRGLCAKIEFSGESCLTVVFANDRRVRTVVDHNIELIVIAPALGV